jgi:hypothetical protein
MSTAQVGLDHLPNSLLHVPLHTPDLHLAFLHLLDLLRVQVVPAVSSAR